MPAFPETQHAYENLISEVEDKKWKESRKIDLA